MGTVALRSWLCPLLDVILGPLIYTVRMVLATSQNGSGDPFTFAGWCSTPAVGLVPGSQSVICLPPGPVILLLGQHGPQGRSLLVKKNGHCV